MGEADVRAMTLRRTRRRMRRAIRTLAGMQARMRKGQGRGTGEGVARENCETALVLRRKEVRREKRVAATASIQIAWHDN
jgi:hypothetical protein